MGEVFDIQPLSKVARRLWDRYGNATKLANAAALRDELAARQEVLTARPWRVVLESGNVCNLTCCADRHASDGLAKGFLSADDAEVFLGELWSSLVQVNLFNWGEPFLNRQLDAIVKAIHDHGVGVQIHSNMNHLPDDLAERVIAVGLDFLIASIDGVTQDVYAAYRRGGQCGKALDNLRKIVKLRNEQAGSHLRIVWRFLCFPHNRQEIAAARALAEEIGVDDFTLGEGGLDGVAYSEHGQRAMSDQSSASVPYCTDVYDLPVIHWDGSLLPCCNAYRRAFVWGDLRRERFDEAFNSEAFRVARAMMWGADVKGPCRACVRLTRARFGEVSG